MTNKYRYKVAFSQIDITPNFQVELIGANKVKSNGVLHKLYAQILLFQNDVSIFCIVTIDNLGLTKKLSNDLRFKIAKYLDIDISSIMLCFSHTHAAPEPTSFALNGEMYFKYMCDQIIKCVQNAKDDFLECKIGKAITNTNIGDNRREGCTIVDDRLGIIKVIDSKSGELIVVILRITAHANVLMGDNNLISSDYFGIAREKLQNCFSCPVMLIQGAAGNIKPVGTDKIFGGKISDLYKLADILEDSIKQLNFEIQEINDIQMVSKNIVFYSDVPSEIESTKIMNEALKTCNIDGTSWSLECERLRRLGIKEQLMPIEVQFFKLNDICICGVSEEIFCEISLEVQEKVKNHFLFFNGYTNGCTGYLPTKEEWKKGGYEILYSYLIYYVFHEHLMPYREDTADRLISFVVEEWENIRNA